MRVNTERLAHLAIVGLLLSIAVGILIGIFLPTFPLSGYIAAVSTFVIAIMTVEYVVTTKQQFSIMEKQLAEMKLDRELDAQPVPVVTEPSFLIEQPRLFYSPDDNYIGAHSRYRFKFSITNRGIPPALSVISTGVLLIPTDNKPLVFESASRNINALEHKSRYPENEEHFLSFLYPTDHNHELLSVLREGKSKKQQTLVVKLVYKNALGACFIATSYFLVYVQKTEEYELLGQWHSRLAAFPVEFKSKLEQVKEMRKKSNEVWHEVFGEVENQFSSSLPEVDDNLEIKCIEIPNSFELKVITKEQYNEHSENIWFGSPVPEWVSGCLAELEQ